MLLKVFEHLDLVESDYFGLKIVESEGTLEVQRQWLDPRKSIRKQIKGEILFSLVFFLGKNKSICKKNKRDARGGGELIMIHIASLQH